ncbi:MAG: DUF4437 domain-containing protein [Verrucomicrobiota bacterium]
MRKKDSCLQVILALALFSSSLAGPESSSKNRTEVILASEIDWEALNPARGDRSPQAGTLWGDRNAAIAPDKSSETDCPFCSSSLVPTGFLAKFVDGFSSPPHIHNVTYRAVVISGLVHNDDPDAADMWMPPGSFWTQPKGEVHITSAKGETTVALVEIDTGPYLVMPPEEAFDSGERPVNVHVSNVVWVNPPTLPMKEDGPRVSYLWGDPEDGSDYGTFIKLPAGFEGYLHSTGSTFRLVTIEGHPEYLGEETVTLSPGSYLSSSGDAMHQVKSSEDKESVFYVRSNGPYRIISAGNT